MTKKIRLCKKIHEGQTFVIVDIENEVGASELTSANVVEVRNALELLESANIMQVVACSHHNAEAVLFNWPKARIILRSGKDGADIALINVVTDEHIGDRFDRVVIASGDGIFAQVAKDLLDKGVKVNIVCGRGKLAKDLRQKYFNVRYLPLTALELKEHGNV